MAAEYRGTDAAPLAFAHCGATLRVAIHDAERRATLVAAADWPSPRRKIARQNCGEAANTAQVSQPLKSIEWNRGSVAFIPRASTPSSRIPRMVLPKIPVSTHSERSNDLGVPF